MTNEVTSGALGRALGITTRAVRLAVEAGRLTPWMQTPGGHLRWAPAEAAKIVRANGRTPPRAWEKETKR